jgi:NAD(P)-dependent dehydrogenase (short-subunit alcohol dehydrogenase family)
MHPVLDRWHSDRLGELNDRLSGALAATTDVTIRDDDRARLIQAILDGHGGIDGPVNNAGDALIDIDLVEFTQVLLLRRPSYPACAADRRTQVSRTGTP